MQNKDLIAKVIRLVTEERRIGVEILQLLQKIENRKAYCDLNYDGLFSFCVKELHYSEAQAARRIQAMRALKEHPELKEKIEDGVLTVTTVSQIQSHLKKQAKESGVIQDKDTKLHLFESMQNHSAKEVEEKLNRMSGGDELITLVLKLNPEMKAHWDQVKNLSAHVTMGNEIAIFQLLMKEWLKRNDPLQKTEVKSKHAQEPSKPSAQRSEASEQIRTYVKKEVLHHERDTPHEKDTRRHAIPARMKRFVWKRDQGSCTRCGSQFALQYDHQKPFAKGGDHSPENIRLLCKNCNLHAGIKEFGMEKMRRLETKNLLF